MESTQQDAWFEVSPDDWLDPAHRGRAFRAVADAQFPKGVLNEIRAAGIRVEELPRDLRKADDVDVLRHAARRDAVLLTLEDDFWSDRKFPLHLVQSGILFIDQRPGEHKAILYAFGLVFGCFAKNYPLDWWRRMKVKARIDEFQVRTIGHESRRTEYRMRLRSGRLEGKTGGSFETWPAPTKRRRLSHAGAPRMNFW